MSTLVYTEVLMPAFRPGSTTTPAIVLSLVQSLRNIARSAAADATCIEAARLRATHNLRTPDAIHAATAPIGKADGMLTNDRRLTRLEREGLKVWQIDDLV